MSKSIRILVFLSLLTGPLLGGCVRRFMTPMYEKRAKQSYRDMDFLNQYGAIPEPDMAFTLQEVIDRALCKNLDLWVDELDVKIQYELATKENLMMIPHLENIYEFRRRNNNPGSSSMSLDPNVPPAPPSVSTEKGLHIETNRFLWNLMDLGVAFFLTRKAENQAVVRQMEYSRLRQNVILKAMEFYWQAIAAQRAVEGSKSILKKVEKQQKAIQKYISARILPKITGLQNEATLMDVKFTLEEYKKKYDEAIQNLGRVMGITPGVKFSLMMPKIDEIAVDWESIDCMEDLALTHRPELYSKDAEVVIRKDEVRAAFLKAIPGFEFFLGHEYNSNSFLVENHWITSGLRLAWDLFNVPINAKEMWIGKRRINREWTDRVKVSMSVLAQLHLSYVKFLDIQDQVEIARERKQVKRHLMDAASKELFYGEFNAFEFLQYEREALMAEIQFYENYGDMRYMLEQVNNSMGIPLFYFPKEDYET